MILQGVLDTSFGGFLCLRGFASMRDLSRVSIADKSYQRDLRKDHQKEMISFLSRKKFLFFPEVILGTTLDSSGTQQDKVSSFFEALTNSTGGTYTFDNFSLKSVVTTRKNPKTEDVRIKFRRANLKIPEKSFPLSEESKFFRIDGNHRLSILDADEKAPLTQEQREEFGNLKIPFCLILFQDIDKLNTNTKAIFHNINYKQIPLTMEENLHLILDDVEHFPDSTLHEFGEHYPYARTISNEWDRDLLSNLNDAITKSKRTLLIKTLDELKTHGVIKSFNGTTCSKFKKIIAKINDIYEQPNLKKSTSYGLLGAFIFYAHKSPTYLNSFKKWVLENHVYQVKDIEVGEIIKIFDPILLAKKRTIFVSMAFNEKTEQTFRAIKQAVEDLNDLTNHDLELDIRKIRVDYFKTGFSYKIDQEILSLIADCGLLIADLSQGNKNVYHEIGYLMGLNKSMGKEQNNFILLHNASTKKIGSSEDVTFNEDVGFNLKTFQVLSSKDTNDLREIIKKQIATFYKISLKEENS